MRASEVIATLERLIHEHGDCEVGEIQPSLPGTCSGGLELLHAIDVTVPTEHHVISKVFLLGF